MQPESRLKRIDRTAEIGASTASKLHIDCNFMACPLHFHWVSGASRALHRVGRTKLSFSVATAATLPNSPLCLSAQRAIYPAVPARSGRARCPDWPDIDALRAALGFAFFDVTLPRPNTRGMAHLDKQDAKHFLKLNTETISL